MTLVPLVKSSSADFVREQIKEAFGQGAKAHINADNFPLDQPGTPHISPRS